MKVFEKIYTVVARIPKGKVMTYGQVAKQAGIANPRIVGFAMRANKDTKKIPCHRVVGKDGKLQGYAFGGVTKKQELLQNEGVKFINKTSVDLSTSLYRL